jgi:nickel-dependent lactate racemase
VDVIANAVLPETDHMVAAAVGPVTVHDELVNRARQIYETPVPNAPYDVVIAGVGAPKDANLYQASRAATYIGLSGTPVIRPGGVVIVPATMPEGAGEGVGEQNFYAALQEKGADAELIRHLREVGCRPGEQRAYMMAQLLEKYHCIFVGANDPGIVTGANLMHAPDIDSALKQAADLCGNESPKTLVVPHALKCIPTTKNAAPV